MVLYVPIYIHAYLQNGNGILTNDDNVTINYNDASLIFKTSLDETGADVFELSDGSGAIVNYALSEDKA